MFVARGERQITIGVGETIEADDAPEHVRCLLKKIQIPPTKPT